MSSSDSTLGDSQADEMSSAKIVTLEVPPTVAIQPKSFSSHSGLSSESAYDCTSLLAIAADTRSLVYPYSTL